MSLLSQEENGWKAQVKLENDKSIRRVPASQVRDDSLSS